MGIAVFYLDTENPASISERLMTVCTPLVGCWHASHLSTYTPPLPTENKENYRFYQLLDDASNQISRNDKITLIGNCNARVGSNIKIWHELVGEHHVGQVNSNGIRLVRLCAEHDFTITSTVFQQKYKYKTSWMYAGSKPWHSIYYIIVRHTESMS